ncbi:unnamed protein product, partial [marine sediment metagenome]
MKIFVEFDHFKVIFVENFPNSAKLSSKVAEALQENTDASYLFIATRESVINNIDIESSVLLDTLCPLWLSVKLVLHQLIVASFTYSIHRYLIKKGNVDFWCSFSIFHKQEFPLVTAKSLMRAVGFCWKLDHVIKIYSPKVIASTSIYGTFARASAILARKYNTSSLLVQHGILNYENYESKILQKNIAVWGERDKRFWLKNGIRPENIYVTGSPKFDDISQVKKRDINRNDSYSFKVAYFPSLTGGSTISEGNAIRMLEVVMSATASIPGTQLIIKTKQEDSSD